MTRILAIIAIVIMSFMLFFSTTALPALFDPEAPASTHISDRYIEKSHEETGSPNFVTAVLADYRGYDTLGETTVIFTAGIAAALLLRLYKKKDHKEPEKDKDKHEK